MFSGCPSVCVCVGICVCVCACVLAEMHSLIRLPWTYSFHHILHQFDNAVFRLTMQNILRWCAFDVFVANKVIVLTCL